MAACPVSPDLLQPCITPASSSVVSIPDWGLTPFNKERDKDLVSKEIDQFNLVNQEEAEKRQVTYVDITPISRDVPSDPFLVATAELHPSEKMYQRWVDEKLCSAAWNLLR